MESFFLIVGAPDARSIHDRVATALHRITPRVGAELIEHRQLLPEISGAFVCVRPDSAELDSLLDSYASADCFVAVFGKLTGQINPARVIHDLATASGARWTERARELDGVFSAVVVDRRARTVTALTDIIGCRSLLWHQHDGVLVISPHALGLVATGRVPLQWDLCSVAASTCVDWSVGRAPLLQGVHTLQAFETLRWSDSRTRIDVAAPMPLDERIHALNFPALAAHDATIADAMIESARAFVRDRDRITISLTRGLDSRAVLAVLHAAGVRDRLQAQTVGQPGSLDVEGARALAEICGIPHHRAEPPAASTDDFIWNTRLNAFLTNGDANAKQSLTKRPQLAQAGSVSGGGGEIYTGMYYPLFVPFGVVPDDPARVADIFMSRARKGRWDALGAWSSPLRLESQQRLERALAGFRQLGARGPDLVDLLYLWERYAHWGAVGYRRPWSHGWTPFATARAVRGFFRYPRAAAKYCNVHARVVHDNLPLRAYLMPVNGTALLPLRGRGQAAYMLRQAQLALSLVEKKVISLTRKQVSDAGVEKIWARMFATDVYDTIHALLVDPRSLAVATFGPASIQSLLDRHRRDQSQLQPLGALVMIEQFRLLAEESAAQQL
jgi:hypothetical protein